jgi:hypothetical protein
MGKTGAARRAGFAVGDDFLALLLHAITSFRVEVGKYSAEQRVLSTEKNPKKPGNL